MRKPYRFLLIVLCLLLPGMALAEGDTLTGDNLLYNADFSVTAQAASLPSGWELEAYDTAETEAVTVLEQSGNYISINNTAANDARVCQTVAVEPSTGYRLSGRVRTIDAAEGNGATLSIDNYALDGTYCYSGSMTGTSDGWQDVTLYFTTGVDQEEIRVALRLGGYGKMSSGTADFQQVALYRCEKTDAQFIDLATQNGYSNTQTDDGQLDRNTVFTAILGVTALGIALYVLLYVLFLRHERPLLREDSAMYGLWVVLLIALLARILLSLIFYGHPTDINCFMAWGNAVEQFGPGEFYTSGMFADYPPGYMYVLWLIAGLGKLLNLTYGSTGFVLLYKLPAIAADLVSAYLVYRLAKRNGLQESFVLLLCGILALHPTLMFVSGAWGQIDSILTLGLVLTCMLLQRGGYYRVAAGAVYGLSILFKPQALMLGPLLAVAFIADIPGKHWKKKLLTTVLAVVAALVVLLGLSLPFQGTQDGPWLIEKYLSTTSSYPYASIEAFNMAALLGDNWAPVATTVLGVSYQTWGTIFIALAVVLAGVGYVLARKRSKGALYLSGAFMIAMIFTFGHYMHERYLLPVFLLLLIAYAYYRDRRILAIFGGFTFASLLNVLAAMYIVNHQDARGGFYNALTGIGAFFEVATFLYLAFVSYRILIQNRCLAVVPPREDIKRGGWLEASPEDDAAAKAVILPDPVDHKLRYTRKDWIFLLGITLIYGAVALFNLGTTSAPETHWKSQTAGETVTIEFDKTHTVSSFWVYGNIENGGTLLLTAPDGHEETFEQVYDDMFRWKTVQTSFTGNTVSLQLYSGGLDLNEIAFFDETGALIPAKVVGGTDAQNNLLDEQDTVPAYSSYYNGMYFDELYHARTAYEHLHNLKPYENSHPPLGKIIIMLGVAIFGMNPLGWRIMGALFGVAMLPVLYALAKRIFKRSDYALVTTALFAFDFMHFTQTRIATIDVFAVFFILLMYYYMYQYICMDFFTDGLKKTLRPLALAGVFFGVGAATKWICIYAGAGLAALFFWSLIDRGLEYRRVMKEGTAAQKKQVACFWQYTLKTLLWCCLFYLLIPFAIYFASYWPYFRYESGLNQGYDIGDAFATFWRYQEFMYSYHSGLNATHPFQSSWWQWPFTLRPMWYYFTSVGATKISTLTASGNPAVWWVSTAAAVVLLAARVSGIIRGNRALRLILIGILANFLPWVLVTRCTFIYHFFATVPFLLLAAVYLLYVCEKSFKHLGWIKWVWLGIAVLCFVLLYPGLSGYPVDRGWAEFLQKLPGGGLMYGA